MSAKKLCLLILCAAVVSTETMIVPGDLAAQTCEGDCNGDHSVTIDEIIVGVHIAIGNEPVGDCRAMDGDGDGAVTVNELLAAVTRATQGCGDGIDETALVAATRVATEPLFRLFDFQTRVATPRGAQGRSTASGCQQFDCVAAGRVTGTEEDCCSARQFTQVFDNCMFDDGPGRIVSLNGAFVLNTDAVDVCTGAIPVGASFTASLQSLTHDIFFADGSFSRTFQELNETFGVASGGCTVREPDPSGFGIRGDGHRLIDGELQQFQSDSAGNVLVDSESDIHALAISVDSTMGPGGCSITAALNGSVTSADFRAGTQFSTDLTDLRVVQSLGADATLLELNGTVSTDCLGQVTLSTIEPLRIASGGTCFTAGRLEAESGETESVTYTESGLDFDFGADGSVGQHFATCTDVPASDKCRH
jgi:hypothetical protein